MGIDVVTTLELKEYNERNKNFKTGLLQAFSDEELNEFRSVSGRFLREASEFEQRRYALHVLQVFSKASGKVGEESAARMLSDLIMLLPEAPLRRSLHKELLNLLEEKKLQAARAVVLVNSKQPKSEAHRSTPEALPPEVEALPISRAFGETGSKLPSLLAALHAVLEAMSDGGEQPPTTLNVPAIFSKLRQLDVVEVESLQHMQDHLIGGDNVNSTRLERLLALRASLLLKLQAQKVDSPMWARARTAAWREWKVAATTAVQSLSLNERICVQFYILLCMVHLSRLDNDSGASASSGVATSLQTNSASSTSVPAAPTQEVDSGDFPALTTGVSLREKREDPPPHVVGGTRRKGRQRQVLMAWG